MVKEIKRLQIGKNGLTNEFIEQVKSTFLNERVVKISILRSACRDKDEAKKMANELVEKLGPKFNYKLVGYVITVLKLRKNVR